MSTDPSAPTQPSARQIPPVWDGKTIPIRTVSAPRKRRVPLSGVAFGILAGLVLGAYLLAPFRINLLLLGIDRAPEGTVVARSDTVVLLTARPLQGSVGMLSIPRDLWVEVPGYGPNRINAAHALAESEAPGTGPEWTLRTVRSNFGIDVYSYARIQFNGLSRFVDVLGGLDIDLPQATALYPAGENHLTGAQALALVRDRQGSDDFARMERGQLFLKAVLRQALRPATWPRLVVALPLLLGVVDSNLPLWDWPRLAVAVLRAGPDGLDARTITREMVDPFATAGGANVLAPNWALINPVLLEMFGQ